MWNIFRYNYGEIQGRQKTVTELQRPKPYLFIAQLFKLIIILDGGEPGQQ